MWHVAACVADRVGHQHVGRNVPLGPLELGQHAADVRVFDAALKEPAGLHHLMARVVDSRGRVVHRAHQGKLVGVTGHAGEQFRNLNPVSVRRNRLVRAADFGRRVGLHVPRVDLAGRPHQEKEDTVDILFRADGAVSLQPHQVRHAQTEQGERAGVEKVAPSQAITKMNGLVRVESKHGTFSFGRELPRGLPNFERKSEEMRVGSCLAGVERGSGSL